MTVMPDFARFNLLWGRLRQTLWWRPTLWGAAAVAAAFASFLVDVWVPADWLPKLPSGVVDDLLHIMASSMLVVSTFALSVLAGAYASASSAGTPRATRLVVAEPRSQKAVAAFLAAFIFSVVGVIALGTGRYGASGRMALFVCALAVLAWVVVSFMRYIDVLSRIGLVSHTIETVERAAAKSLRKYARQPLGGARAVDAPPAGSRPILSRQTGHVQFVDVPALQELARRCDGQVHLAVRPGDLVHPAQPLAWLLWQPYAPGMPTLDDAAALAAIPASDAAVREAFVIGPERSFEQDAGFGLIVLAEIAQRALSPAVNDPGTAIAVLGSQTRLLIDALATPRDAEAKDCDRVTAAAAEPQALVAIAYDAIARCSMSQFDVMLQWLRHIAALVANAPPAVQTAALELVQRALARAARSDADAADLSGWYAAATSLGLVTKGASPEGGDDGRGDLPGR
jgi:uncharacterized membrane protein